MNSEQPGRRSLRDRFREESAQEILAAAELVFSEQGLAGASMSMIAERAGVAVGTLYNRFKDRESLLQALLAQRRAELLGELEVAARQLAALELRERLTGVVHGLLLQFEQHRPFLRLVLASEWAYGPSKELMLRALRERMDAVLAPSRSELREDPEGSFSVLLNKAGTLTNADLLRVQVALSNARQQEIVAVTGETVARASLLSAIGRSPDDVSVEFVEPTQLLEQSQKPVQPARLTPERRPEVRAAALEARAAHHDERSRFYALLPQVDLNAAYQRVDGQVFAPKNSAFVGIRADWPVFEWGATASAHAAAEQGEVAARANAEAARRRALAELSIRRAQLAAAESAVGLARESLGSAAEAYRVTEAVVKVGSGTTTDLLDAQSSLTSARLSLTHSEYERAIAFVQLERATGASAGH
ncbi:MAG: TolC family protein [Deltaproteobacteria bacterium]